MGRTILGQFKTIADMDNEYVVQEMTVGDLIISYCSMSSTVAVFRKTSETEQECLGEFDVN